jgi:hypothetical protein
MIRRIANAETGEVTDVPMTPEEVSAMEAAHLASLPPPSRQFTWIEFTDLFTPAEEEAVMAAALRSAPLLSWVLKAAGASYVDLDDPRTSAGIALLVQAGLLTQARADTIMQGRA